MPPTAPNSFQSKSLKAFPPLAEVVLGGGLEPPCLSAYAPQTYVSAISPPEQTDGSVIIR